MNNEILQLLSVRRLPGRVNAEQASHLLGFMPDDIPILVKAKIIKPLGSPLPNAVKYFAATEIEKFAQDAAWLSRATNVIYKHWSTRNQRRNARADGVMEPG